MASLSDEFLLPKAADDEPIKRGPGLGPKGVGVIGLVVIVLAFIAISRPTDDAPDELGEEAGASSAPAVTPAPTPVPPPAAGVTRGETTTTEPFVRFAIPEFGDAVPADLPGVISGLDGQGSIVVIDRSRPGPQEFPIGMTPAGANSPMRMILVGVPPMNLARSVLIVGGELLVEAGDGVIRERFDLLEIASGLVDGAVLIESGDGSQQVALVPRVAEEVDRPARIEWVLPSLGPVVLGQWEERSIVLSRANEVWLLDESGESTHVADGEVLSYDGRHLARLVCEGPEACSLVVGTPDQPDARRAVLPAALAALPQAAWVESVAVTPDGRHLATAAWDGSESFVIVVDLADGSTKTIVDTVKRRTPMAWSPDGLWLTFLAGRDVKVWRVGDDEPSRIGINRELRTLFWR